MITQADDLRVRELRSAIGTLWNDRDDPRVMSELVVLMAELRAAEKRLEVGP